MATKRKKPPKRAKKKAYHHGDLRRALLEEALVLIQERGPEGFTLREVAHRAGVTHTAPYRHFPTKVALLAEVATAGYAELRDVIAKALTAAPQHDLRAKFVAGAYAYVKFAVDRPAHFRVMFLGPEIEKEGTQVLPVAETAFGLLLKFIPEAQDAKVMGPGHPLALALPIWAMHHGLACLASTGRLSDVEHGSLRRLVDEAHIALLEGLASGMVSPPRLSFSP